MISMQTYKEGDGKTVKDVQYFDFDLAKDQILKKSPADISRLAAVDFDQNSSSFNLKSLGQDITVSYPECRAKLAKTGEEPVIEWHIPILHYLATADGGAPNGTLVSFAEIEKHVAHPWQFEEDTGDRLMKLLDSIPLAKLEQACLTFDGVKTKSKADLYVKFPYLPKIDIFLQVWLAEEGIPGSAKFLFDKNCVHYLNSIDLNFAGVLLTDFLIKQCG